MRSLLDRFRRRSSTRTAVDLRPRITTPFDPSPYRPALALIRIPQDPRTTATGPAPGDEFGTGFFVTDNGLLLTAAHNLTEKKREWDAQTQRYSWVPDPRGTPLEWVWVCCYETATDDWTDPRRVKVDAALIDANRDAAVLRVTGVRASDPLPVAADCRPGDNVVVLAFQPDPSRTSGYNARCWRCFVIATHPAGVLKIAGDLEECLRLGFDRGYEDGEYPTGEGTSGGPVLSVDYGGCPAIAIEKWVWGGDGLRLPEVETTAIQWLRAFLDQLPEARDITWLPPRDSACGARVRRRARERLPARADGA